MTRILYVGTLNPGGTCRQRMLTLRTLGHEVMGIDTVPGKVHERRSTFAWRVRNRLLGAIDESHANARLLRVPQEFEPEVVWFDKPLTIEPATVQALQAQWPGAIFLAYSGDDMFNPRNQSWQWRASLPLYHVHVSTKTFNVPELLAAGARDAFFVGKGFAPEIHHPHVVTPELTRDFGGDVGFVGWPEHAREKSMRYLAAHGVPVRVWGPWPKWKSAPNLRVEGRPLWDHDYAKALSSFRINLGFLRRVNRDLMTTRSVEVPACGGFLLAERTDEHMEMFRDGVEAVFFNDDRDLLDKVRYYLAHEEERATIAQAGLLRCLESGYANEHRLTQILRYALTKRTTTLHTAAA
jgi:hypothetical protein